MSKIVNGRKPLSSKPRVQSMSAMTEDIFGNRLALPPELKEELEKQGLVGRFVNSKTIYNNQGYHPKGWKVYKRKSDGKVDGMEFKSGSDPEGLVRRGDCILAVKNAEEHKKHKDWLEAKADAYKGYGKKIAKELREHAEAAGARTYVDEGYGEEDEQED